MEPAYQVKDGFLCHYGMPRRSGRYPWGSGDDPYQHGEDLIARVDSYKKKGMSETEIAEAMGLSTYHLRTQLSLAKNERRALMAEKAKSMREHGKSLNEIADALDLPGDSSVRSLLKEDSLARTNKAKTTADLIKKVVDDKGMVDVSTGVERELGVSQTKLNEALYILQLQGYEVYSNGIPQVTNEGKQTTQKVIGPPGMKPADAYEYDKVHSLTDYKSDDGGETFHPSFVYPKSMDSSRLKINYAGDDEGDQKDGNIEIRRGVKDLDLGPGCNYAQVRILVDNSRYLKGMATYGDDKDFPKGVDVIFNTNKKAGTPKEEVLKKTKDDPANPFGSAIKENGGQHYYIDDNGKEQLSLINKRAEEGDWGEWSKRLPSQFLAKQNKDLIEKQLKLTLADYKDEYDQIQKVDDPVIKKKLLQDFSNKCTKNARTLNAAALPRQAYQVILPIKSLKDDEVYAPNFKNGETVALIRYPHAGTFEIAKCRVNNNNVEGQNHIGKNPADAIGINSKVASRLSGADFDGDTVQVIPCNSRFSKVNITSTPDLPGMRMSNGERFDPSMAYPTIKKEVKNSKGETVTKYFNSKGQEVKILSEEAKQRQMGITTNLIADMSLKGATEDEMARAVKHSMVVIDAVKHELDYRQSYKDNDIAGLKKKYQLDPETGKSGGVSTLITRAKSPEYVSDVKTNRATGSAYTTARKVYKMDLTNDARTLSSGTAKEEIYADFANALKGMSRTADAAVESLPKRAYSKEASRQYEAEVKSIKDKINTAALNAPKEREAQRRANVRSDARIKRLKESGEDLPKKEQSKIKQQELTKARQEVGAKLQSFTITPKEYEAMHNGAVSTSMMENIIQYCDLDSLRALATPKSSTVHVTPSMVNRMQALRDAGYTTDQIAQAVGVSTSTVSKNLRA